MTTSKGASLRHSSASEPREEESMTELKERLRLAELGCSRLQELCQEYRLRWLEEDYRAKILEEYAPHGISTCSPRQIAWDTPSPIRNNDDDERGDLSAEDIPPHCCDAEDVSLGRRFYSY